MALTITINGSVTLDESSGLQNAASGTDADNDVLLSTLQSGASAFYSRLFGAGGLNLSTTFASTNGVAQSASNFISVGGGNVTSLGFVDGNGAGLATYAGVATGGTATSLSAVNGGAISLFKDATLGDRMVLGVDANNDIVFALFLDPDAALSNARVWMVQFEAISNPNASDPDDAVNLLDSLGVGATQSLEFNFNTLPSGQNLFGVVGDTSNALVVIGKDPVLNANGTFTNTSNTINTSQGGGGVTIGVNNQMFDVGEGAYFTLVKSPNPAYLSGVVNGLDQNEADDAKNISYGSTLEVTTSYTRISQIQGNSPATMKVTAIDMAGAPLGIDFALANDGDGIGQGTVRTITKVEVFNAAGTKIGEWTSNASPAIQGVDVQFNADKSVDVSGLGAGFKVQWTTDAVHDQVLIVGAGGKFDIGAFGTTQVGTASQDIGEQVRFEDSGPTVTVSVSTAADTLTVDDSTLATNATANLADNFTSSVAYGTDGQGAAPSITYTLGLKAPAVPGGTVDSGLDDSGTGSDVLLFLQDGKVVGRIGGANGDVVFEVSVSSTGIVTLDQQRAVKHPNTNQTDESITLASDLINLTRQDTVRDGDQDVATGSATINLANLVFKDDGPSTDLDANVAGFTQPTVDETALNGSANFFSADSFIPGTSLTGNDGGTGTVTTTYTIDVADPANADSGLDDTLSGDNILLRKNGNTIEGYLENSPTTLAFTISIDGNSTTGAGTLTQLRSVVHDNPNDPNDITSLFLNTVKITRTDTVTDNDGDSASVTKSITVGQEFRFVDDGPEIDANGTATPTLTTDDTGIPALAGPTDFSILFTRDPGNDGFKDSDDDDVEDADAVSFALDVKDGGSNVASGLTDTLSGGAVVLNKVGNDIVGTVSGTALEVLRISVNADTGAVTFTQSRSVVHDDPADPFEEGASAAGFASADLVTLTATITDGDGDSDQATRSIGDAFKLLDDGPSITVSKAADADALVVDESALGSDATANYADNFTTVSDGGKDGIAATGGSYALEISAAGAATGLVDTASGQNVVLSLEAGAVVGRVDDVSAAVVFRVTVNSLGEVTLDQQRAVVHPSNPDPDDSVFLSGSNLITLKRTSTITDGDGDSQTASYSLDLTAALQFKDDGPSVDVTQAADPDALKVDETLLGTNASANYADNFASTSAYGEDKAGAIASVYTLGVKAAGVDSGLDDSATGQNVLLYLEGGEVVGRVGGIGGAEAFRLTVSATGTVTLDQVRALKHPDATKPDDSVSPSAADLITLTRTDTITDKDGDSKSDAFTLNIANALAFEDDGPAIGPVADSIVDFAAGSSQTKTLDGKIGADANASPYTVTAFTQSLVVNGVTLQGVASAGSTVVSYFADSNNSGTFGDAGDIKYYELSLSQTANSGAGSYTFTALVNPPPSNLSFNFNTLPSGQNLFGVVGDTSNALVVIGRSPVLNADGTFTNTSNTINTSQGGGGVTIGVNNQMFDVGEGAYFTLVKNPNTAYLSGVPGGLDQNEADDADNISYGSTLEVTTSYTRISQIQGNSPATMTVTAIDMAGAPQGQDFVRTNDSPSDGIGVGTVRTITKVEVFNAAGAKIGEWTSNASPAIQGVDVVFNADKSVNVSGLGAGFKVQWTTDAVHDQVLIVGAGGKFDIGEFGANQAQPTPDQVLDFTVRATDADGDFVQDSFKVGIDGTGVNDDGIVAGVAPNVQLIGIGALTPELA